MDVLGLDAFIRIAECGSFRRAATMMNLSQAALSHRIKKLEADIGISLFQRTTRTLTLTRSGQEFFPKARDMLFRLNGLYDELKIEGRRAHERLAIGCLASLGERYLPDALRTFRERYPGTKVVIHDETAATLSDRVVAGEIQFALTILGAQHWALKSRVLFDEDFAAAVPAHHPLADRASLKWTDLVGHPLARVAISTSHGFILSESLGTFGPELNWCYEVQRTHMAVSLVLAGLAITVLPRAAIADDERLRVIPIGAPTIKRTVAIISRNAAPLSPQAVHLQRILLRAVSQRGPRASSALNDQSAET
ncbi:MAG: LysR family transcriptional regulator [Pseudolabrys sp.]|nr:LysR family transcriptional regulator [Pseudolabrys sp.]